MVWNRHKVPRRKRTTARLSFDAPSRLCNTRSAASLPAISRRSERLAGETRRVDLAVSAGGTVCNWNCTPALARTKTRSQTTRETSFLRCKPAHAQIGASRGQLPRGDCMLTRIRVKLVSGKRFALLRCYQRILARLSCRRTASAVGPSRRTPGFEVRETTAGLPISHRTAAMARRQGRASSRLERPETQWRFSTPA
jgi:hypothetical protein